MTIKLPRMQRLFPLVETDGKPNRAFHKDWDYAMETIESALNSVIAAQAAADAANAAAAAADAAALAAQGAADDAAATSALSNSGVTGATLTGTDAGANATVTISAHTRVYGDGTSVSVNGGSVTGLAYSTLYYVYYDQPSRAGGAVTYAATTSEATAAQTGNRHLVGSVTTPAAAAGPTAGDYVGAPGVGSIIP
jgi:hypothetical protein